MYAVAAYHYLGRGQTIFPDPDQDSDGLGQLTGSGDQSVNAWVFRTDALSSLLNFSIVTDVLTEEPSGRQEPMIYADSPAF